MGLFWALRPRHMEQRPFHFISDPEALAFTVCQGQEAFRHTRWNHCPLPSIVRWGRAAQPVRWILLKLEFPNCLLQIMVCIFALYHVFPHWFIFTRWNELPTVRNQIGISGYFKNLEDLATLASHSWECQASAELQPPLDKTCALQFTTVLTIPYCLPAWINVHCHLSLNLCCCFSNQRVMRKIFQVPTFPTKVEKKFINITCLSLGWTTWPIV